jgi:hypothetical protein
VHELARSKKMQRLGSSRHMSCRTSASPDAPERLGPQPAQVMRNALGVVGGSAVWTTDPFVGTWRDASRGSATRNFTMFIAKTGTDYDATLFVTESTGSSFIVHVPLTRMGHKLTSRGPRRPVPRSGPGPPSGNASARS